MIRLLLIAALFCARPTVARASHLWLVVGASDPTAAGIARKARTLSKGNPNGLVVQTHDCGDRKKVFAWASDTAASAEAAQEALLRARTVVKDAYVKQCDVKPGSLLALRFPAVDSSIADVPDSAVNWQEADRVSSALPLSDGRALVVVRYFQNVADDPLEGRRERVVLMDASNQSVVPATGAAKIPARVLEENCPSAGRAVALQGRLAFDCAREQAGEQMLHSVHVFDKLGNKLMEVQRCRRPRWSDVSTISCDQESVGADGRLKLRAKRLPLTTRRKAEGPDGGGRGN